ncbi:helix-turn-helix transcriptional regulator [Desulfogranum japonicum]|uniref:helix-turn-helix transcriptional regulator n=1 Tax=Desulfogranum japonicum TaxID=231447 RepID=UPI0006876B2C|nr:AraC family transcriptional regulator [Desulfogranum japonicum]
MEIVHPAHSLSQDTPEQLVYKLPQRLGCGIIRIDNFSSGLRLLYMDMKPHKPITLIGRVDGWSFGVGFSIIGHSQSRTSDFAPSVSLDPGMSGHFIIPDFKEIEEDILSRHKLKVCVLFDTKTLLNMANEDEETFLPFLKGLREQVFMSSQGKILPQMSQAVNQLIACPYSGKTRALFLEGKAMELLAHRLEQLKGDGAKRNAQPRIKTIDVERIHYAAELLAIAPADPPDISTLASKVGMSRSKLYQCFKIVYGHSPLDHLRRHRLRIAKDLLQQGRHNVTEAAYTVGYNNLGYFAKLFLAEFGIPPHKVI